MLTYFYTILSLYKNGKTPLHQAVAWGDEKPIIVLLSHAANVNAVDNVINTPNSFDISHEFSSSHGFLYMCINSFT